MALTRIRRTVYTLLGVFYVVVGAGAMVLPIGWLPQEFTEDALEGTTLGPFLGHLLQEFGTVVIAVGLVFFWLAARAAYVRKLHWLLTFYLALDGLIHWVGPEGIIGSWPRGLMNSIAPVLMLTIGLLEHVQARSRARS